ncbi:TonB-dependent receptor [Parabacteroides sp. OttesenSCG-928-G06]|nr:TonB-dependent receptor [Parabacteroides sp. OttesenSCG-928-K15]MDL2282333.1 TonB-dependent receptor [Parabacteroides sp. OttesenSCG-928-G06]
MKKKKPKQVISSGSYKKLLRIMKLGLVCMLLGTNILWAGLSYAQKTTLDLSLENVKLEEVFEAIRLQSEFEFFYNDDQVDTSVKVSVKANNAEIMDVLKQVLPAEYEHKISDRYILISKRKVEEVELLPQPQQEKWQVSGTVKDINGEEIIGANILEKGTVNGVTTDIDGKFSIRVNPNATLLISYIGYVTQEINVQNQSDLRIIMLEDAQSLEEVVVVGYGVQKKVNLTGAVSSISFEEQAQSRPITNVSSALSGLSAGLQVTQGSGNPGSDGATIRIRGVGTLNDASPLYIIDGMQGSLDAINPNDIESISILKDAASSAIYGVLGANGVVLVTTKKGDAKGGKKVTTTYSGRVSTTHPTNLIDLVTDYADYMEWMNESSTNIGQNILFNQSTIDLWREKSKRPNDLNEIGVPNYVAYPNTNWQEAVFSSKVATDHNVSVSGKTESVRFLLSAGYLSNPGLVDLTGETRYTLRANVEADITKWLTVGTRTFGSMSNKEVGSFSNANNYMRQTTPGVYPEWNGTYGYPEAAEESPTANSLLWWLNAQDGYNKDTRFNTTLFTKVKVLKGLSWDFNFNYTRRWQENRSWTNPVAKVKFSTGMVMSEPTSPDKMTTAFSDTFYETYTLENLLHYNTTIARDHDIAAILGYNEYYYNQNSNTGTKQGLIDHSVHYPSAATEMLSMGGAASDDALRSIFGRVNYAYKSKYLFEATVRRDGSSRYHEKYRWGTFPSFSAAWRLTEEDFMASTREFLDNLKIRASWGQLGNNKTSSRYPYQSTYSVVKTSFGGTQVQGLRQSAVPNDLLQWETLTSLNLGLDVSVLRNRLTLEFDVYEKKTDDILYQPNIFLTAGSKTKPYMNIAQMKNYGTEITLGWKDRINGFSYSISGNISYNQNKVTEYKGKYEAGWVTNEAGNLVYESNLGDVSTGTTERVLEGKIMQEYYMLDIYSGSETYFHSDGSVDINGGPKDGMIRTESDMEWLRAMVAAGYKFNPGTTIAKNKIWYGDYIYADGNGDGTYGNAYDEKFQGVSKRPKYVFGLQAFASYKGFDFSMNWAGQAGYKLLWGSSTGYNTTATRSGLGLPQYIMDDHYFYDPENPSDPRTNLTAKYPRLTLGESGQNTSTSTKYLHKGDYIKLKNVTVGYTIPKHIAQKIYTQNVRVYFSGENLWTITSYPGMDPEMGASPGYVTLKQFAFGLNVTF